MIQVTENGNFFLAPVCMYGITHSTNLPALDKSVNPKHCCLGVEYSICTLCEKIYAPTPVFYTDINGNSFQQKKKTKKKRKKKERKTESTN